MQKLIFYCDKCGELIGEDKNVAMILDFGDGSDKKIDLCPECMEKYWDLCQAFIAGKKIEVQYEDEQKEPVAKSKKAKGKSRVKLDLGRIGALRSAGWSVKAIAEEMKCSENTIYNHLDEAMSEYNEKIEKMK